MAARPRKTTGNLASLSVLVPRWIPEIWQVMRDLDAQGTPWRASEVERLSGAPRNMVDAYLERLVAARFATSGNEGCRLICAPAEAPHRLPGNAQQQMWTALRSLGRVSAAELAHAASTDITKVSLAEARRYLSLLQAVDYVTMEGAGEGCTWRLAPRANTGPIAPMVLRTTFLWDPNSLRPLGHAEPAVEVRI